MHKRIPHDVTYLSADKGDLNDPSFRALNPHGKAPVLVDGDFSLFESDAIVDYLEDGFPQFGPSLWPREARARALARRIALEASAYLYPPLRALVTVWSDPNAARSAVEEAKPRIKTQLDAFAALLFEPYFTAAGPGAADFAVYPLVALIARLDARQPEERLAALVPEPLRAWSQSIEALPGFAATCPPHWRASQ